MSLHNEMIERVARAIYLGTVTKNGGFSPRYERRADDVVWREFSAEEITSYADQNWKSYEAEARAAISEALK